MSRFHCRRGELGTHPTKLRRLGCIGLLCLPVAGLAVTQSGAAGGAGGPLIAVPKTGAMVSTTQFKKDAPWTIGYADSSLSNSWRVFAWQYMQYEASKYPIKIVHTNANDSIPKQVSDIQNLLSKHVDCLIVSATSDKALNPIISVASKQVPVVIQERSVTTTDYTSFAALDAVQMGRLQAEAVAKALHGKGNIVILEGVAGSGPVDQSLEGMHSVLKKYPGINVLTTQYTNWSAATAKTQMQNDLTAFPKIDGVLSDSGLQQQGAFEAVQAAGRLKEVKVWTGDDVQVWLRTVHQFNLPGVIVDRPTLVAETSVKDCIAILQGQSVPKLWQTVNQVIPAGSISKYLAPNTAGSDQWWDWWDLPAKWRPKA
jgi:ribose transport system substrate-binding protein